MEYILYGLSFSRMGSSISSIFNVSFSENFAYVLNGWLIFGHHVDT